MNKYLKFIGGFIAGAAFVITLLGWIATAHANPFIPFQGGTGTSIVPTLGQIPVGTSGGVYGPTTTLAGGITNASGTHIGADYSYLVSKVSNEGDFTDIQSAINADCALASPGLIFIKNGVYALGSTGLTVSSTCSGIGLVGESESSTVITYTGSGDALRLGDASGSLQYAQLNNLKISGSSSGLNAIHAERLQTSYITNIYLTGFTKTNTSSVDLQGKGIDLDGLGVLSADNYFCNIHADHNDIALLIASTSNANYFCGLDFYGQNNASSALAVIQSGVGNTLNLTNISAASSTGGIGVLVNTQRNLINVAYSELLGTGVQFGANGTNNVLVYNKMSNVTTPVADNSSPIGTNIIWNTQGANSFSTSTEYGDFNVLGQVISNSKVVASSSGNATVGAYSGGTGQFSTIVVGRGNTDEWVIQLKNDGTNTLHIVDAQNGGDVLTAVPNGSTTIDAPNGGSIIFPHAVVASTTLTVNQSTTFKGSISSTIASALLFGGANGVVVGYGGTSCSANQALVGLNALGVSLCGSIVSSLNGQAGIVTAVGSLGGATGTIAVGSYLGMSGGTLSASSTLASSSATFIFQNPTTTPPNNFYSVQTSNAKTITSVNCYEYAAATTTVTLYYETSTATSSILSGNIILSSIACGIAGTSTATFTTSSLPINAYLYAAVSSTAGSPLLTTLTVMATKL